MVKRILIITVLVFICCKTNKEKENIDNSMVSEEPIESVKKLSHSILTAQKNGEFYALSSMEATPKMITGLNERVQKESYKQIKNVFGAYKDLEFDSIEEIMNGGETYKVYRFKGDFEFGAPVEVRSVINDDGKLAGFFVKPWQNKL